MVVFAAAAIFAVSLCFLTVSRKPRSWLLHFFGQRQVSHVSDNGVDPASSYRSGHSSAAVESCPDDSSRQIDVKVVAQDGYSYLKPAPAFMTTPPITLDVLAPEDDEAGKDVDFHESLTPKAKPAAAATTQPFETVPVLSLASDDLVDSVNETSSGERTANGLTQPVNMSSSSLAKSEAIKSPLTPSSSSQESSRSASSLMPPPSVRGASLRPLPRANGTGLSTSSLAPPPSTASSLRTPTSLSGAPNSLATSARNPIGGSLATPASTSTLPPASRPSRKVILPPGHSPLDWAALCRSPPSDTFLRGADVPPGRLIRVSPKQLRYYNGRKGRDAWGTYEGKVYNLTPYKNFHPGGVQELMRGAGRPGETERLFKEVHPWVNWDGMLSECLIGILVGDGEDDGETVVSATKSTKGILDLEAMD